MEPRCAALMRFDAGGSGEMRRAEALFQKRSDYFQQCVCVRVRVCVWLFNLGKVINHVLLPQLCAFSL